MKMLIDMRESISTSLSAAESDHVALQYAENVAAMPTDSSPWSMLGTFIQSEDLAKFEALPFHHGIWNCYALRLAILYDAPLSAQISIIEQADVVAETLVGTIFGAERSFLKAMAYIRKEDQIRTREAMSVVENHHRSESSQQFTADDYRHQLSISLKWLACDTSLAAGWVRCHSKS